MQTLMIERMEPGNPDSLYRAEIGNRKIEGLTYQEAIDLMIRADGRRGGEAAGNDHLRDLMQMIGKERAEK